MLYIDAAYNNYVDFLTINSHSSEDAKKFVWSKEECEKIISLGNILPEKPGLVSKDKENFEMRKVIKYQIPNNKDFGWIYEKIYATVMNANSFFWNYDIDFIETLELLKYSYDPNAKIQDHYDKHSDFGPNMNKRKLTYSATLSDPLEYKGGDLTLCLEKDITIPREQGQIVLFPSFQFHSVSNMEEGTRWSLVTWVSGRPFK